MMNLENPKSEIRNPKQIQNSKFQNSKPEPKTDADKQITQSLNHLITSVNSNLDNFRFGQAAHDLYDFIWHDLADKYIEKCKKQNAKSMPEEIWQTLKKEGLVDEKMLITAAWPQEKSEARNASLKAKHETNSKF